MGWIYRIFGAAGVVLFLFSSGAVAAQKKPWTFLFFVAGDEPEIDAWSRVPIRKLEQIGSDESRWIVAHADLHWDETGKTVSHEPAKRYVIEKHPGKFDGKDFSTLKIASPVVWTASGEEDSSAGKSLAEFIRWAKREYPADHYALFVLGHSWGWRGIAQDYRPGFALPPSPAGVTVDFTMASLSEFRSALKSSLAPGEKLDLLVLDACNDGVLEVAYEVRDLAKAFLAAPTEMPFLSFDYVRSLSRPWRGVNQFAADLVEDAIVTFGRGGSQVKQETEYPPLALVAADLEKMNGVWSTWSALSRRLPATNFNELFLGEKNVEWLDNSWNVDFAELNERLMISSSDPEVRGLASQILVQLGEPEVKTAFDREWRTFSAAGVRSVLVEMRADDLLPRDKALSKAEENFDYMNPHLRGLEKKWLIEKSTTDDVVLTRVSFAWPEDKIALRPFIAGGNWARITLRDDRRVLRQWVLTHPTAVHSKRYRGGSPYLATAHTFGVGRIRGFTVNLDTVVDLSVPANHHYAEGAWLSGRDYYRSVSFARDFGWGDLLFTDVPPAGKLPRYRSRSSHR